MEYTKVRSNKEYGAFLYRSKVTFEGIYNTKTVANAGPADFEHLGSIASGAFGHVILVRHIISRELLAMKVLIKAHIAKMDQIYNTLTEKRMLLHCVHPNLAKMLYYFQNEKCLYFVMPYYSGGDLFALMHKKKYLPETWAAFYVAQIVLALEYLHYLDIIYRDLKPENIFLGENGYVKLGDFGFCKGLRGGRTYTICGTPEYLAPEVILMRGYRHSCDWWSVGVLIYELIIGRAPFQNAGNHLNLYSNITDGYYSLNYSISNNAKGIIRNLLVVDITNRLGCMKDGVKSIKSNPWFSDIDWLSLFNGDMAVPYFPEPIRTNPNIDLDVNLSNSSYSNLFKDF